MSFDPIALALSLNSIGGVYQVFLATTLEEGANFSDSENEALNEAFNSGKPIVLKGSSAVISGQQINSYVTAAIRCRFGSDAINGRRTIAFAFATFLVQLLSNDGENWTSYVS